MKKLLAILSLVALSGSIYAGCGVKVPKIEDLKGKKVTVSTDKHTKKGEEVKADKA